MAQFNANEQTNMAIAALTACLVRALEKSNPGVTDAFVEELKETYQSVRSYESEPTSVMETIKWTNDFIKVPR